MRLLPLAAAFVLTPLCAAQIGQTERQRVRRLPKPQPNLYTTSPDQHGRQVESGARPAIMLTGYWSPTNFMVRAFSTNPALNPNGWIGSNWEGRGYDVYSYFPDLCCGQGPQGSGDLEVDYQDTSADFWPLADGIDPVAIITFSRGLADNSWEVEYQQRNLLTWFPDYTAPVQPTPAPPDASVPVDTIRLSTLPVQEIVDFIDLMDVEVEPYVNFNGFGGGFLSEFIAYHGTWYQDIHSDPSLPDWCVAGGHVHVGVMVSTLDAKRATKATLRRVLHYVDGVLDSEVGNAEFFCTPERNSINIGAQLTQTGSVSLGRNDLELIVTHSIAGEFGFLFYGAAQQAAVPMGNGRLCVAGTLFRVLPAQQAGQGGLVNMPLDLTGAPFASGGGALSPGTSAYFQYWYRDTAAGGSGSNTSSGLGLTFQP